jgi:hypothetical protein
MTYQRSDATPGDLPSLFDKASTDETADKTISILSAATGRDGVMPVVRKKNAPRRFMPLWILLTTGVAGGTYWHFNHANFDPSPEAPPFLSQRTPPALHTVPGTKLHASAVPQAHLVSLGRTDTAVVEIVKDSPAKPAPLTLALKETRAEKAPPVSRQASSTRTLPPTTKSVPHHKNKSIASQDGAHSADNVSVAFIKKAAPAKPQVNDQQSVVVRSATDTDVKLLEGILRLMKRDDTQDTPAMRAAK